MFIDQILGLTPQATIRRPSGAPPISPGNQETVYRRTVV